MALKGVCVLEFAGLAPAPFCGMILADFGADVIRVDRAGPQPPISGADLLARGKRSLAVNLKSPAAIELIKSIIPKVDVLIEPYRPGVMERLGLGPNELLAINPRLIYARLTGFGQTGPLKDRAGHDINYVATSGLLSTFHRVGEKPMFPANVLGDFAGGSMVCAYGIVAALFERTNSGKGQVIDTAIADGAFYLGTFVYNSVRTPVWDKPPGHNFLDSGNPAYEVYETKDGKYMAIGSLEPQFHELLLKGLNLIDNELAQSQSPEDWPKKKALFSDLFKQKSRDEWTQIFENTDACVTPVFSLQEVPKQFLVDTSLGPQPAPHPKLSRTPAVAAKESTETGANTVEVLKSFGLTDSQISSLLSSSAVSKL